jgi:hypothetical protein
VRRSEKSGVLMARFFTGPPDPVESKNRRERAGMPALRCKSAPCFPADDAARRPPPFTPEG